MISASIWQEIILNSILPYASIVETTKPMLWFDYYTFLKGSNFKTATSIGGTSKKENHFYDSLARSPERKEDNKVQYPKLLICRN